MVLGLDSLRRPTLWLAIVLTLALTVAVPAAMAQTASPPAERPGACSTPADPPTGGPVVVQGWVINHRELVVDGTRTSAPLRIDAISSAGSVVSAAVGADGFFKLALTADVWNFSLQLPADWDGIVPLAPRGGLAITGCTPLAGQKAPYVIVFKIRRLFDVTARKWEELTSGAVQPGPGWQVTFQPIGDPFAVPQTQTTAGDGTAVFTITPGTWLVYEWYRSGWDPLTPPQVTIKLDQYAGPDQPNLVVFKNRHW